MTVVYFPSCPLSNIPQQTCVWLTWTGFGRHSRGYTEHTYLLKAKEVLEESKWRNQTEVWSRLGWIYYAEAWLGPCRLLISCQAALLFMYIFGMCDVCMQLQSIRELAVHSDWPPADLHACSLQISNVAAAHWDSVDFQRLHLSQWHPDRDYPWSKC